ncbi:MAG: hypothetical protein Q7J80_11625, partial [Anaerolineales bacterium]|nr:hypothetical protein [Anaerolineales bacterium]
MAQKTGDAELLTKESGQVERAAATASYPPLKIESRQGGTFSTISDAAEALYRRAANSLWATVEVYTAGGLVYALILATAMILAGGDFSLRIFLWLIICYAWPTVLAINLVIPTSRWGPVTVVCGYFAMVSMIVLYAMVGNASLSISELVVFWLLTNAAETLLLVTFLHRR